MFGYKEKSKALFQSFKVVNMVRPKSKSPHIKGDSGISWVTDGISRTFIDIIYDIIKGRLEDNRVGQRILEAQKG